MEMDKVKRSNPNEEDENGEEDEKMEQFFDLIRRFQGAKNRLKGELRRRQSEEIDCKNKRVRVSGGEKPSWIPAFEPEDFTEEFQFVRPATLGFASKEETKTKQKQDLDLNLSL